MSNRFLQLERSLRAAVARRSYAEAQKIAAELSAQAAEDWRALPRDALRARGVFDRLQNLLEWSRLMTCASRASQADELRRARLTNRYFVPARATGSRLRFDI